MNTVEANFVSRNDADNQPPGEPKQLVPIFPKASSILLNSGNIVVSGRLKKRTTQNPQDELNDVLNNTISSWLSAADQSKIHQDEKYVEIRHPEFYEKVDQSEKNEISSSVKLFLNTFNTDILEEAIDTIMQEIGIDQIDTLILSLPNKIFTQEDLPKELILPLWSVLQQKLESKQILSIGVVDFNAKYIQQLFDMLNEHYVKPSLNQVNLTSCCKMPEDLVEFSKINNVQLTTHIDPSELLTIEALQSNIRMHAHEYDSQGWLHSWIARYTLILKGRGIVKSKGYAVKANREIRFTKQ